MAGLRLDKMCCCNFSGDPRWPKDDNIRLSVGANGEYFKEIGGKMSHVQYVDELVKEYLLFRGFSQTLKAFDNDLKAEKEKGFRVRIVGAKQ